MSITIDFDSDELDLLTEIVSATKIDHRGVDELYSKLCSASSEESDDDEDSSNPYELSDNQKRFVKEAKKQNLEINWCYSGRGMFGRNCPAVLVDDLFTYSFRSIIKSDNMGRGYVVYAQD